MSLFRCLPIPTETAARFRRTGVDDRGNRLRRSVADAPEGFPCRHCLRMAQPGEALLLGAFDLPRPQGIYWTPSPIFVHEADCPAYAVADVIPDSVRGCLVSLRSYDASDVCLYDLGVVCDGGDADAPLRHALADPRTAFVNIHTARPGCWLARAERT